MVVNRCVFVAATGQHVGKTTTSLGLMRMLRSQFSKVGFMKPVGQNHVSVGNGINVDKDVQLFREFFGLEGDWRTMSPVIVPRGFTKRYIDGKETLGELENQISNSFEAIRSASDFVLLEGTGHVGVGNIIDLSNARVAQLLDVPVLLVASGGLGSSFDEVALNRALLVAHGVKLCGVVLNKVEPNKIEMVTSYYSRALARWNIPLIGVVPQQPLLSMPTIGDLARHFGAENVFLCCPSLKDVLPTHIRLVACSVDEYIERAAGRQLIVTPSSRTEVLLAAALFNYKLAPGEKGAIICTGAAPPSDWIISQVREAGVPMIHVVGSSYSVMSSMLGFTAKIRIENTTKIEQAVQLISQNLSIESLLSSLE